MCFRSVDEILLLVKFIYNNNYHFNIGMKSYRMKFFVVEIQESLY